MENLILSTIAGIIYTYSYLNIFNMIGGVIRNYGKSLLITKDKMYYQL